jgi:hypothetical protein
MITSSSSSTTRETVVLAIEDNKHRHHLGADENLEFVRKSHKRSKSPALITFLAGGKGR